MTVISIEYNGVVFDNLQDLANKANVKYATLYQRIKAGWSIKEAVEAKANAKRKVTFKNKIYPDLSTLIEKFGIASEANVRHRLKAGWTLESAVSTPDNALPSTSKPIIFRDKNFASTAALCRFYNVDSSVFHARIRNKWSMEEALGLAKRINLPSDTCKGKVYRITNVITGKCYIGLTTKNLKTRLAQHISKAKFGDSKLSRAIRLFGPEQFSISLIAESTSRQELSRLETKFIKKYKTLTEGYNCSKGGNLGGGGTGAANKSISFNGKVYPSVAELCRAFNIQRTSFEARFKRMGWTMEETLGITARRLSRAA